MKMEMTNEEIRKTVEILSTCREKGKLGYAIARNTRRMKDAVKEYMDIRDDAIRKCGTKTKNGQVVVTAENEEKFLQELDGIGEITAEVDVFLVDEETFLNGTLDSHQMENLLWMIKETKEE